MKKYINPEIELYQIPVDVITSSEGAADNFGNDDDFMPVN